MAKGSLFKTTGVRPKGFKFPVGNITANAVSESDSFFDSTGGTKTYSGDWVIHTFTTSGTFKDFTASTGHECEYLIVSGGGAGGSGVAGGGGGAGGVLYGLTMPVVKGKEYTVVIGAGGDPRYGTNFKATGANGSNSSIGTFTFEDGDAPFGGVFPGSAPTVSPSNPNDGSGTCLVPGGGGGGTWGASPFDTNPQYGGNPALTDIGWEFTERGMSGGSGGGAAAGYLGQHTGGLANLGSSPSLGPDVEPNSQSTEGYTSPSTSAKNIGAGGGAGSVQWGSTQIPNTALASYWGNYTQVPGYGHDMCGGGGGGVCGGGGAGSNKATSPDIGTPGSPSQTPQNSGVGGMGITLSISGSSATYGGGGGGGMSSYPKNDPQIGISIPNIYTGETNPLNGGDSQYGNATGTPWPDDWGSGGRGQAGGGNGGSIHPYGGGSIYSPQQYSPPAANGINGSVNRGGGGGGGGGIPAFAPHNASSTGGSGGSGVVIIRYNKANEAFKVT